MSSGLNLWVIEGNVGRDANMRFTQSGVPVCDFSVAVSESLGKDEAGNKREKVTWVKVTAWRALGEVCGQYVKKGMKVLCIGSGGGSAYIDKDGQPALSLELTADKVVFLSGRDENGAADEPAAPKEDIPF